MGSGGRAESTKLNRGRDRDLGVGESENRQGLTAFFA